MEVIQTGGRNMISATDYLFVICQFEKADALQQDMLNALVDMQNHLTNTNANEERQETLRQEIEKVRNDILIAKESPPSDIISAVQSLQFHVTSSYGDLNQFLSDNSITVSPYFANLSRVAGYAIEVSNIGSSCLE